MKTDSRLLPLYLSRIFYEKTDEDHYLSIA